MNELLLIVEDEADLAATLRFAMEREGYRAITASCGEEALKTLQSDPRPDLVLLDLMLPDMPGTEVCRRIRADERTQQLPVIMLTARTEEIDRVVGFEVGADDYVTKPFSVRELMLRVRAVLRRRTPPSAPEPSEILEFGVLRVDVPAHRAWVTGEDVALTALEFRLLMTFIERKGRVQSREVLLADVWNIHADVTTRTVDTHVKRLREKLGVAGAYIETLRGVGYRMVQSPSELSA